MMIFHAGYTEKSVCSGKVAGFDCCGLKGEIYMAIWKLEGGQSNSFLGLRICRF